jgi:hypothetical protein
MTAGYTYKSGKWIWNQTPKKDLQSQARYKAYRANPAHYKVYHYDAKKVATAKAQAAQRAADRKAKADVAEQRKKDGILGNIMKGNFSAAWDNTVNEVWDERLGNSDWRKHKAVDIGIKILATVGTAACIASAVCGMGLFVVGASALFVAGLGAHMAVASEEQRRQGAGQFMLRTAKAEVTGMAWGTVFGRGMIGAVRHGGTTAYSRWAVKGGHARVDSMVTGPRSGGLPLRWNQKGLFK